MKVAQPIRDLQPLNIGGTVARAGFEFQDHVAVWFCLEMLVDNCLKEVWCETQDDITLIWQDNGSVEWVEFVQVKDMSLSHFWSIPELCKQEKGSKNQNKSSSSILEKSLAQDRCQERCQFRVITSLNVNNDLEILTWPLSSPIRSGAAKSEKLGWLIAEIDRRLPGIDSPEKRYRTCMTSKMQ